MKLIWWKNLFFYLLQSAKFMVFKILTFHIRKIKTGVLLIRNDSLGDFLISLPLFEQIAAYAHARNESVTIAVSDSLASFCREFPFFDNVVPLPRNGLKGFKSRIRSFRAVTRYQAEKVILFLALGRSGEHDYMATLLLKNFSNIAEADRMLLIGAEKVLLKSFSGSFRVQDFS